MGQQLDETELVSYKELLIASSMQTDALAQLLIEKDIITEEEFYMKLKVVQADYQKISGKEL